MTSLTAIFGNPPGKPKDHSEKLQNLYWKRAELKKELAGLRDQKFRLQDTIKRQEGSMARLQQQFDHLEGLLLDSEWAYNIITYYQFRSLNIRCKSKLAIFAEQLKQQREQRLHDHLLVDWNNQRMQEATVAERKVGEQRLQVQMLEDQLQAERHRLEAMGGFMKIFRRRSNAANLDNLGEAIDIAKQDERDLIVEFDEIRRRNPPVTQGLDIATKRQINFMIMSFSQHLYLHYDDDGLAAMSKDAGEKSVGAIHYGCKADCDRLLALITKRKESYEALADFADQLQKRAKLVAEKAQFGNDDDAVPISATVSTLFSFNHNGVVMQKEADLLGENYWDLSKVLAR